MKLLTLPFMMMLTASAEAAPVPKELKHSDSECFQGLWAFETYDRGGRQIFGGRWIFDGDKMFANGRNTTDQKGTEFRFELRKNRSPAEIDIYFGETLRCSGIYEFSGGDLHIAYSEGSKRPSDYSSAVGKDVFLIHRVPEAKK